MIGPRKRRRPSTYPQELAKEVRRRMRSKDYDGDLDRKDGTREGWDPSGAYCPRCHDLDLPEADRRLEQARAEADGARRQIKRLRERIRQERQERDELHRQVEVLVDLTQAAEKVADVDWLGFLERAGTGRTTEEDELLWDYLGELEPSRFLDEDGG